jgi:hypothetical protein
LFPTPALATACRRSICTGLSRPLQRLLQSVGHNLVAAGWIPRLSEQQNGIEKVNLTGRQRRNTRSVALPGHEKTLFNRCDSWFDRKGERCGGMENGQCRILHKQKLGRSKTTFGGRPLAGGTFGFYGVCQAPPCTLATRIPIGSSLTLDSSWVSYLRSTP